MTEKQQQNSAPEESASVAERVEAVLRLLDAAGLLGKDIEELEAGVAEAKELRVAPEVTDEQKLNLLMTYGVAEGILAQLEERGAANPFWGNGERI